MTAESFRVVLEVMRFLLLIVSIISIFNPNFGLSPEHRNNPRKMKAMRYLSIVVATGIILSYALRYILPLVIFDSYFMIVSV